MQFAFPPELKDEIRDRIDIVALVGEVVKLKKSGSNFSGLCPFHKEKTPSFSVNPSKKIFYCFGCKEGGDCFKFVMKTQNIGFGTALEKLAVQAGIDVSQYEKKVEGGIRYQRLYDANAVAQQFFATNLKGQNPASEYLKSRGLTGETAKQFGLGFAPDSWTGLLDHLREKGYSEAEILAAGLARRHPDKGTCYDYFRNRVTFPIKDEHGKLVAFGGRTLGDDRAKYLNSPETDIYSKGRILYNLHSIKKQVESLVVVEGYMDVVGLAQGGVTNAIAVLGTALTEAHIRKISQKTKSLYLAYDPDEAGIRATYRSLDLLENENMNVRVLSLPEGMDPDEFVLHNGNAAWQNQLDTAAQIEDYLIDATVKKYDLSQLPQRREAMRELQHDYRFVTNPVGQDRYRQRVAAQLQLAEDVVRSAFSNERRSLITDDKLAPRRFVAELTAVAKSERYLLACLLTDAATYARHRDAIRLEDLEDRNVKRALEVLAGLPIESGPLNETLLSHVEDDEFASFVAEVVQNLELPEGNADRAATDCLGMLRKQRLQQKVKALSEKVKSARDASEREALSREHMSALRELNEVRM